MGPRRWAVVFILLAGIVAAFQLALIAGAPWGHLTWGGRFAGPLPASMRLVAALSFCLIALFALIVAARAGLRGPAWRRRTRLPAWGVVGYCSLGVLANAVTPSPWERIVWLPVVTVMLIASTAVARATPDSEA